jgi:hypothetical protein
LPKRKWEIFVFGSWAVDPAYLGRRVALAGRRGGQVLSQSTEALVEEATRLTDKASLVLAASSLLGLVTAGLSLEEDHFGSTQAIASLLVVVAGLCALLVMVKPSSEVPIGTPVTARSTSQRWEDFRIARKDLLFRIVLLRTAWFVLVIGLLVVVLSALLSVEEISNNKSHWSTCEKVEKASTIRTDETHIMIVTCRPGP